MAASRRVLIVGAGPGGLATGMLLAHQGFDVQIFEKNAEVGGRTGSLEADGYRFDVGPTLLMMKYILDEVFERAGRRSSDYLSCQRLEPSYRLELGHEQLDVSSDPQQMHATIAALHPGSERGYAAFLVAEQQRFERLFPCMRGDFSRFSGLFRRETLRALPHIGLGRSLYSMASGYFRPELLRLAFSFQSAYLGMSPWDCPAGFAMVPFVEHAWGVYHVIGGLNRICHAMRRAIKEDGGRVHSSSPVRRVLTRQGRCLGLELADGTRVEGDEVVLNADFTYAAHHLFEEGVLGKRARRRLQRMDYSCSAYLLYLGLDTIYDMPHHRVLFSPDYRDEMQSIFTRGTLGTEASIYLCNPSVTDPTMAPPGHSSLYVLVLTPNLKVGPIDWEREEEAVRDRVLDVLEGQRGGMPGLRRHIQTEVRCTPQGWREGFHAVHGAAFSFSHVLSQLLWFRPHARIPRLENAYMVGGGTSPGSGLPTILESGRIACDLICAKHGLAVTPPQATLTLEQWSNQPEAPSFPDMEAAS